VADVYAAKGDSTFLDATLSAAFGITDDLRVGSPKPIPWRSGPLGSPGPAPVTSRSVRDNLPA